MKIPNTPKHQTSKVENRDQQTKTRIQNFGCATCFRSRCVGELEGGILPYAEWTGNRRTSFILGIVLNQIRRPWTVLGRQKISDFRHRFESISKPLDRLGATEGSQGSGQACKDPSLKEITSK